MPFAGYPDMDTCIADNQEKDDPGAYCAVIKRAVEGSQFSIVDGHAGRKLLLNMDVFTTGYHVPAQGETRNWSPDDLRGIVEAFKSGAPGPVYLKVGHTSPEFCGMVAAHLGIPVEVVQGEGPAGDGMISLGRMIDLRLTEDGFLVSDWECPSQVADLIELGYTDVSVELMADHMGYPWVMSAVALLGAQRPAIKGLDGIAEMAVLVERQPALVTRFKAAEGRILFAESGISELEELEEINSAMQQVLKGKKSAHMLRQVWGQVRAKWETLIGVSEPSFMEVEVDIKALAKRLGMAEKAEYQEDEVMARLDQIMSLMAQMAEAMGIGGAPPPEEEMGARLKELVTKAHEVDASKFGEAKYAEQLHAAEARISSLEKDKRLSAYRQTVVKYTAVAGTVEELATELLEIEDKLGQASVTKQLDRWQQTQKYAEDAGLFTAIGSARPGDPSRHELEGEMEEWSKTNGKSPAEALAHFRAVQPGRFNEYRRAIRNGGGE